MELNEEMRVKELNRAENNKTESGTLRIQAETRNPPTTKRLKTEPKADPCTDRWGAAAVGLGQLWSGG